MLQRDYRLQNCGCETMCHKIKVVMLLSVELLRLDCIQKQSEKYKMK
jgi:hypothetical protein